MKRKEGTKDTRGKKEQKKKKKELIRPPPFRTTADGCVNFSRYDNINIILLL